ncbi:sulfotransferase 6B1 isoform X2 [Xenopus laevis]|uniref:Sulfotransferase n=1 Tax=Xenopus laevis TaxID=8355 RepID=A0A8J1KUE3_XENLA|nr:sulfotransferase 6B1 isoform X2 [Xenopus laevis]
MASRKLFLKEVENMMDACKDIPQDDMLFTYNGTLYPKTICHPETFKAMESFQLREDDLLIVSYPKCGSNWTYQILQDILYAVHKKEESIIGIPMLEFGLPDKYEMLVVFRNPKDTAVSFYHFYNNNPGLPNYSSWDTFFQDFTSGNVCFGSYFDYALTWNKHIDDENVLIMTFEEMKEDLYKAVKKICIFFGYSLTEEQVQYISDKGTFKSMKEKSGETHGYFGKVLFRKGDVGDWKNHFSEAQSKEMDAKFEEYLAGTKLGNKMKYNIYC